MLLSSRNKNIISMKYMKINVQHLMVTNSTDHQSLFEVLEQV